MNNNKYSEIKETNNSKSGNSKLYILAVTTAVKAFKELEKENIEENSEEFVMKLYSKLKEQGIFKGTYNEFKNTYLNNK